MKIRNVAFIAALIVWIALAVYYVTPSESAVAKEIETAPKTVGETLSAIAQSLKHEGEWMEENRLQSQLLLLKSYQKKRKKILQTKSN